tara:strand:- start:29 stop:1483 length:1455 start_codon:yes stop_codon:yes gene_type:complete
MKSFGNIAKDGQVRAVASGALTDGKAVIVNSDGTVSVVAGSATSANAVVFEAAATDWDEHGRRHITYDTNSDKIVITYQDDGNNGYGTAIVGTVSGTSISFGSPVVYQSNNCDSGNNCTFDSSNNKIVVVYRNGNNSDYGTSVVGTVSGTSISFGTPVVFHSANSQSPSITFDSNANKVVLTYYDGNASGAGKARVGTVSGTSISWGSATQFTPSTGLQFGNPIFDPDTNKIVIAFSDASDGYKGKCVIGTVSGTSISFGTAVTFNSGNTKQSDIAYNTSENKVMIVYKDDGNSDQGTAIAGTVSGTSISFGSEAIYFTSNAQDNSIAYNPNTNETLIVFNDGVNDNGMAVIASLSGTTFSFGSVEQWNTGRPRYSSSVYDPDQQKIVTAYRNLGNNNYGTAAIIEVGSTNITSENFIGFSDGAFANTDSAAINTTNTIDRNQSGLTAGQTYFVQNDGTIGTTAADPSVTAGTAISATELIVKG